MTWRYAGSQYANNVVRVGSVPVARDLSHLRLAQLYILRDGFTNKFMYRIGIAPPKGQFDTADEAQLAVEVVWKMRAR